MKATAQNKDAAKQAKIDAKAAKLAKKAQTQKAITLALDFKQNHAIRQRAADMAKVDLFACHALKKGSRGYVALCADKAQSTIAALANKEATHVLCVGAVANKITLGSEGFYSRAHGNGALVGNVDALSKLYGKQVLLFSVSEIEKRFSEIKEQVTRKIGTGKAAREIVGREFVSDGDHFAMFGKLDNGKIVIHNGEFSRNSHNYGVRAQMVQTTVAKNEKGANAAQKQAEKDAIKG